MSAGDALPVALGVLVVALAAGFALWPLVARSAVVPAVDALDPGATRYALYRQVLELELDVETGKLSADDFEGLRRDLLIQAAAELRASRAVEQSVEAEVEREIALARQALGLGGRASQAARPEVVSR